MNGSAVPLLGFCAYSGTGKTTLLRRLIPELHNGGLRVGLVKHAHHRFELDYPGKDSYELRKAGAVPVVVASRRRIACITEFREPRAEPDLAEALTPLCLDRLDLVLVEGFKRAAIPKIELTRPSLGRPLIHPEDPNVIAVASDQAIDTGANGPPLLPLNDPPAIAEFVFGFARAHGAAPADALRRVCGDRTRPEPRADP